MNERRLARVPISDSLLFEMMTEGYSISRFKCVKGLPKGAVFIDSYFDGDRHVAWITFEHDSFSPVQAGDCIPDLMVTFEMAKSA